MRSFAYVNPDYVENDSRPQLVEDNPCYQPSVYDQVLLSILMRSLIQILIHRIHRLVLLVKV